MWILVIIGLVIIIKEALQEYNAENYASKKVNGKSVDFFDFMFSNHPWIITGAIFFIILCIISVFISD